jgi:hypothetical protein
MAGVFQAYLLPSEKKPSTVLLLLFSTYVLCVAGAHLITSHANEWFILDDSKSGVGGV